MEISVIIPVYNAVPYLEKAIRSVLIQEEVKEIILVEDGSIDDSLRICKQLKGESTKIKLFRHPKGQNRGAGSSRNLGLEKAESRYIAFLDADDYYLPNRFAVTKRVFADQPDADGVYEALGVDFRDKEGKVRFLMAKRGAIHHISNQLLTTINKRVSPENLLLFYLKGNIGYFSLNGLTIKKSILNKTGKFSSYLKLAQDTLFIEKLMYAGRLYPGSITKAIAMRGVHQGNRSTADEKEIILYRLKAKRELFLWLVEQKAPGYLLRNLFLTFLKARYPETFLFKASHKFLKGLVLLAALLEMVFTCPRICLKLFR